MTSVQLNLVYILKGLNLEGTMKKSLEICHLQSDYSFHQTMSNRFDILPSN